MLTVAILAKCIIFCLFVFFYTMIVQQRARKEAGMTFNNWQTIFFTVGILMLLENKLYELQPTVSTASLLIVIDVTVWMASVSITERMALTTNIAKQYNKVISQSFFLNKIGFTLLIYAISIATKIISVASADFIEQTRLHLWMYEMPMETETYIANYIIPPINQKLSLQTTISLSCALGLACFIIPWYFDLKEDMDTKMQVYFNLCLSLLMSSYNTFIYGFSSLKDIAAASLLFTLSLCVWFWLYGEYSAPKIKSTNK